MSKIVFSLLTIFLSSHAFSDGVITDIWFSGPDDFGHSDIVQIYIGNDFSVPGCHESFSAIRNTSDRQHMISFAIAAYISKEPVRVVLNANDTYFGTGSATRCTISRISTGN